MNIRTYKRYISNLEVGESFYLNTINASIAMIEYTRTLLQTGVIEPDKQELDKVIKKEFQYKFLSGEAIAPQMTYVKKK